MNDHAHLASSTEVIVIKGYGFNPKRRRDAARLATERSSGAIARLASLITSWAPGDSMDWMELPSASLVFLAGRDVLAEFGVLAGTEWIRTEHGDRKLVEPDGIMQLLAERGVDILER